MQATIYPSAVTEQQAETFLEAKVEAHGRTERIIARLDQLPPIRPVPARADKPRPGG